MKSVRSGSRPFAVRSLFHSCLRLARNVVLDLRYGGVFLGGTIKARHEALGAHNISNTDYDVMPHLFRPVEIAESDVLVRRWLRQGEGYQLVAGPGPKE